MNMGTKKSMAQSCEAGKCGRNGQHQAQVTNTEHGEPAVRQERPDAEADQDDLHAAADQVGRPPEHKPADRASESGVEPEQAWGARFGHEAHWIAITAPISTLCHRNEGSRMGQH